MPTYFMSQRVACHFCCNFLDWPLGGHVVLNKSRVRRVRLAGPDKKKKTGGCCSYAKQKVSRVDLPIICEDDRSKAGKVSRGGNRSIQAV